LRRIALLSAVVVLAIAACVSAPHVKRIYWQHRLDRELPAGSTVAQASGLFERARIEHSYDERSHTLYAVERDVSSFLVVSYGIQFQCRFTPANALQSCTAEVYGDGL